MTSSTGQDGLLRGVLDGFDLSDRASYLAGLEHMAQLAFAQDRHGAAERYMTLLGRARGFLDRTPDPDPVASDDLEQVRQLVTRLIKAGLLDPTDFPAPPQPKAAPP